MTTSLSSKKWVVGLRYIPRAPFQTREIEGDIFEHIEEKYLFLVSRYPDPHLREFEYENSFNRRFFFWFADEEKAKNNEWTDRYKFIGEVKHENTTNS